MRPVGCLALSMLGRGDREKGIPRTFRTATRMRGCRGIELAPRLLHLSKYEEWRWRSRTKNVRG